MPASEQAFKEEGALRQKQTLQGMSTVCQHARVVQLAPLQPGLQMHCLTAPLMVHTPLLPQPPLLVQVAVVCACACVCVCVLAGVCLCFVCVRAFSSQGVHTHAEQHQRSSP